MSYSFKIDSSCTIDSEEFEETKDAIDCMAAELDSEFLDIAVKVEEPEYHRDGPIVAKVHGGGAYAELDAEEYDVDVTDFPFVPHRFPVQVDSYVDRDEYSNWKVTGKIVLFLECLEWKSIKEHGDDRRMIATYSVLQSGIDNLSVDSVS